MVMLAKIRRINSCLHQKVCWNNSRRLPETSMQAVNLLCRNDQLPSHVSPWNTSPFKYLTLALYRPFFTSSASFKFDDDPSSPNVNTIQDKTIIELDKTAYRLFYHELEKDDIMTLSALWMQAMEGPYDMAKQAEGKSWIRRREFAYLENWKALGNMSREEAAKKYMEIAQKYLQKPPQIR